MRRFLAYRKAVILLLAVCLPPGVSLSVVQASGMAVEMALPPAMNSDHHACCEPCPGGDAARDANSCMTACTAAGFAVLAQAAAVATVHEADAAWPLGPASRGRTLPPDPLPPKPADPA